MRDWGSWANTMNSLAAALYCALAMKVDELWDLGPKVNAVFQMIWLMMLSMMLAMALTDLMAMVMRAAAR